MYHFNKQESFIEKYKREICGQQKTKNKSKKLIITGVVASAGALGLYLVMKDQKNSVKIKKTIKIAYKATKNIANILLSENLPDNLKDLLDTKPITLVEKSVKKVTKKITKKSQEKTKPKPTEATK